MCIVDRERGKALEVIGVKKWKWEPIYHPKFSVDKPLFYYTHMVTLISRDDSIYDTRSIIVVLDNGSSYKLDARNIMFCFTSFYYGRPVNTAGWLHRQ